MQIIAKKLTHRKLATNSVPPSELETIHAVRTLGEERKQGQYKLVDNDQVKYFSNFKELKFYSNRVLRNQHKHVILVKGEVPNDSC